MTTLQRAQVSKPMALRRAEAAGVAISDSDSAPVPKFLNPVSSEISDFTPCMHVRTKILHGK